jgi:hypothetical protein
VATCLVHRVLSIAVGRFCPKNRARPNSSAVVHRPVGKSHWVAEVEAEGRQIVQTCPGKCSRLQLAQ